MDSFMQEHTSIRLADHVATLKLHYGTRCSRIGLTTNERFW